ncbi:MAG: SAM hydroxide adenosyltransferase [Weeksellaceae bacterium]
MFVTIINDCRDANEMGRQTTRASILFPQANISFMGIHNFNEIEAAGNLVDIIDAATGDEGIIMVNAAPRHGSGKTWKNGTPFGYFTHKRKTIVTTVAGQTLSLAKKFNLIDKMYVTDLPTVIDEFIERGKFDKTARDRTVLTQFRSFEYMPFLAKWLHAGEEVTAEEMPLSDIPDAPKTVWWVDNFGNTKTTLLPEEVDFKAGKKIKTKLGEFTCYDRLKDVPNSEVGLIIGSSGYKNQRFLEIVIQGKSAAKELGLHSGMDLF